MTEGETRGDHSLRLHETGWGSPGWTGWTGLAFSHYKGLKTHRGLMCIAAADLIIDVGWAAVVVQLLTVLTWVSVCELTIVTYTTILTRGVH